MNNSSVSPKKTKKEITSKPNQLTDSELNIQVFSYWVDNLDSATKESFCSFAEESFSAVQVYLYAKFLGYDSSISAVDLWLKDSFSKPDHLKILLVEIDEMQQDIRKLRIDIENGTIKRDVGVARIASMQKELRGTISQVDSFVSSRDRKGLLMAGADRALREVASIFKDDPIEGPLQEASMSVWARMQFED
jgi:hypothetical protein